MRANGNGEKSVCVRNLLTTIRGEIPYDRLRGIDGRIIDRPAGDAAVELKQDATWMIKTYEPRATVKSIQLVRDDTPDGEFIVSAEIE